MSEPTDAFAGVDLVRSPWLVGSKVAWKRGARLYVSPAMWDLLTHAEGEELMRLLTRIRYVEIPEGPPAYGPVTFPLAR